MALRVTPRLRLRVEALDAVWWWEQPSQTLARIAARAARLGTEGFDTDSPPEEIVELLPALFLEGVSDWEGVQDEEGHALRCTPGVKASIPADVQLQVASAYLLAVQELEQKKGPSGGPPTGSPLPESSSPVADTPLPMT